MHKFLEKLIKISDFSFCDDFLISVSFNKSSGRKTEIKTPSTFSYEESLLMTNKLKREKKKRLIFYPVQPKTKFYDPI